MSTRIYFIASRDATEQYLVRAALPVQALRHVASNRYTVRLPTQDELIAMAKLGIPVHEAGESK